MKKKLRILLIIIGVLALMTLFDVYRSNQFNIKVISVDPQPAFADGQTPVNIKLKLLYKDKKPVEGHDIYGVSKNGGSFNAFRVRTDKNGEAEFLFYPYKASVIRKAQDINLEFLDQSNSVFIEINSKVSTVVKTVDPGDNGAKSEHNLNDIFGE